MNFSVLIPLTLLGGGEGGGILETCKSSISGTHPVKFDQIFRNDFTILTLRKGCIIDPEPAHHRVNGKIWQKFEKIQC